MDFTKDCFIKVGWGREVFRYIAVDCTEDCFIHVGWEHPSGILRWTVLKNVLYRLVCGSRLQVYCGGMY